MQQNDSLVDGCAPPKRCGRRVDETGLIISLIPQVSVGPGTLGPSDGAGPGDEPSPRAWSYRSVLLQQGVTLVPGGAVVSNSIALTHPGWT